MTHLRPEELSATLDGALQGKAHERAERHLAECASCRESLAILAEQDTQVRSALAHDPGETYFSTFAARVEDRIRAAGLKGAQSRLGREGAWAWLSPRKLAWAGAVAAVIGGAGIVMLTSRDDRHLLQNPEIAQRSQPAQEVAPSAKQPGDVSRRAVDEKKASAESDESNLEAGARTREQAVAPAPAEATAPATEPAADGVALRADEATAPARAKEVRRNAAGEDVPVSGQAGAFASPPRTTQAAGGVTGAKPQAAPMTLQSSKRAEAPLTLSKDGAASTRLCGRVLDPRQQAVAGATVAIADRGLVTKTGDDGRFCFDAAAGLHELSVMAVGYETTRLQVRVEGESSEALVTLRPMSVLDGGAMGSTSPSNPLAKGSSPTTSDGKLEAQSHTYSYLEQPASAKAGATLERAREAQRNAQAVGTAGAYDAAASAWSKVVPIANADTGKRDALYSVAAARYRAWQLGTTSSRAKSTRSACDAFLAAEPAGSRKDQVQGWRSQVAR